MGELVLLTEGRLELLGLIRESSNSALLVEVTLEEETAWGIYKRLEGERPLLDFRPGLHRRERAAYVLSEFLGWGIVPPTVLRQDGPFGTGSLQRFVEHDPRQHYFTLYDTAPDTHDALRRIALFDLVANNADRKGGHVLRGADGRIWGIDHGLCFAAAFKLRTVVWDFSGEPVPQDLLRDIAPLADDVPAELAELLDAEEVAALRRRVRRLLDEAVLPVDVTGRRIPWPLL
ncbi:MULTISPECIES: SCO1664 family protein [Kocuria]|uniref:SCO1664 family protein n=1 Tax=Kocuria TaxID=57493 RepID=UPI0010A2F313|nr:SCO1664 family protein [Kocuria rosea]THE19374.1 SCO1664 family protein [Kocuria rosea]